MWNQTAVFLSNLRQTLRHARRPETRYRQGFELYRHPAGLVAEDLHKTSENDPGRRFAYVRSEQPFINLLFIGYFNASAEFIIGAAIEQTSCILHGGTVEKR